MNGWLCFMASKVGGDDQIVSSVHLKKSLANRRVSRGMTRLGSV